MKDRGEPEVTETTGGGPDDARRETRHRRVLAAAVAIAVVSLVAVAVMAVAASRGDRTTAPTTPVDSLEVLTDVRLLADVSPAQVDELCAQVQELEFHRELNNTAGLIEALERLATTAADEAPLFAAFARQPLQAFDEAEQAHDRASVDLSVAVARGLRGNIVFSHLELACALEGAWPRLGDAAGLRGARSTTTVTPRR